MDLAAVAAAAAEVAEFHPWTQRIIVSRYLVQGIWAVVQEDPDFPQVHLPDLEACLPCTMRLSIPPHQDQP